MTATLHPTQEARKAGPRYAAHRARVCGPLGWRIGKSERETEKALTVARSVNMHIVDAARQAGCPEYARWFFAASDAARMVANDPLPLTADMACALARLDADVHCAMLRYIDDPTDAHRAALVRVLTREVADDAEALVAAQHAESAR